MVMNTKQLDDCTRAVIQKGMAYRNMKQKDLMEYMDWSRQTFDRRMKDPGSLSLRELQAICRVLQMNPIDRCALISPMSKSEIKDFLLV